MESQRIGLVAALLLIGVIVYLFYLMPVLINKASRKRRKRALLKVAKNISPFMLRHAFLSVVQDNNLPKFCKACGKELVSHMFENKTLYDSHNGRAYRNLDSLLVCPDHKSDFFSTMGHTRIIKETKRMYLVEGKKGIN